MENKQMTPEEVLDTPLQDSVTKLFNALVYLETEIVKLKNKLAELRWKEYNMENKIWSLDQLKDMQANLKFPIKLLMGQDFAGYHVIVDGNRVIGKLDSFPSRTEIVEEYNMEYDTGYVTKNGVYGRTYAQAILFDHLESLGVDPSSGSFEVPADPISKILHILCCFEEDIDKLKNKLEEK